MASYLLTGTSRGLGLAFAQRLANLPSSSNVGTIFATARSSSAALETFISSFPEKVIFIKLDVTDQNSIKEAVAKVEEVVGDKGLDVLVNNAAMSTNVPEGIEKMSNLDEHLNVNVVSVQAVTSAFMPLLRKGELKKIVNLSSPLGAFAHFKAYSGSPTPGYKISKAALNMLTVLYADEYGKEGFTIFALSPGWVRTDMGTEHADISVEASAKAVIDRIIGAEKAENGTFMNIHVPGWEKPGKGVLGVNYYDGKYLGW